MKTALAALMVVSSIACGDAVPRAPKQSPAGTPANPQSAFPVAADPAKVGSYPALTKSGAGYFYDEVLEYRVWVHSHERGDDVYQAFATQEEAAAYAKRTNGAEAPLVLVRQVESINEPKPGVFEREVKERITEWRVEWLAGNKRGPDSIAKFLAEKKGRITTQ